MNDITYIGIYTSYNNKNGFHLLLSEIPVRMIWLLCKIKRKINNYLRFYLQS